MVDALDGDTRVIEKRGPPEAGPSDTDGKTNDSSDVTEKPMVGNNVVRPSVGLVSIASMPNEHLPFPVCDQEGMTSAEAVGAAFGAAWNGSMSLVKSYAFILPSYLSPLCTQTINPMRAVTYVPRF